MERRRSFAGLLAVGVLVCLLVRSGAPSLRAAGSDRAAAAAADEPYGALVIGVPWEDLGKAPEEDAGAVNVLYGAGGGLSTSGEQFWSQDSAGVNGTSEDFDSFGSALAAGDFNGDGYVDLAVGVPGEEAGGVSGAGVVQVFYSDQGRLSSIGDEIWSQGSPSVPGALEAGDAFGSALAAGSFNGDAYDDLAVGIPREDKGDDIDTGAVQVLYGSPSGLYAGAEIWDQDDFAYGTAEPGDRFGTALAVGHFNADAYADLAVGVPFEDWGADDAGAVNVLYGTGSGLSAAGGQTWSQNEAGGAREAFDEFGFALAVGDFDDNGNDDLAIGAPGETIEGLGGAGAVSVMYSQSTGLGANPDFWYQDGNYIRDDLEAGDHFGYEHPCLHSVLPE